MDKLGLLLSGGFGPPVIKCQQCIQVGMSEPASQTETETEAPEVEVREQAFVNPEDVRLLGGAQETSDKIEQLIKQKEAESNTGGGLVRKAGWFGMMLVAFVVGAEVGTSGPGPITQAVTQLVEAVG